jgi:hypothetical protein
MTRFYACQSPEQRDKLVDKWRIKAGKSGIKKA